MHQLKTLKWSVSGIREWALYGTGIRVVGREDCFVVFSGREVSSVHADFLNATLAAEALATVKRPSVMT